MANSLIVTSNLTDVLSELYVNVRSGANSPKKVHAYQESYDIPTGLEDGSNADEKSD